MSFFHHYVPAKSLILVLLEGILIVTALLAGATLRFWNQPEELRGMLQFPQFAWRSLMVLGTLQMCFYYGNLYDPAAWGRSWQRFVALLQSFGAGCLILGVLHFFFPRLVMGRGVLLISLALIGVLVFLCRFVLDAAWNRATLRERVLIIGTNRVAATVASEIGRRNEELNFEITGFLSAGQNGGEPDANLSDQIVGSVEQLISIVQRNRVDRIIVALEDRRGALPVRSLVKLRMMGVQIEDAQTTLAAMTGRVWLGLLNPSWMIFSGGFHRSSRVLAVKRCMDVILAGAGLVLTSPLMLLLAVMVRLDSRGPVLYRQTRVGWKGRRFTLLKFRSMRVDAEADGKAQWALKNDPRVTRAGRLMRKLRLDELPQFLNILRGDMSFVGPRPERPEFVSELEQIIPFYEERHLVRPGLTGWAQVECWYGSNVEDAKRKLEYDLFYMKNMSFFFDVFIVLKTIKVVVTGSTGQ